MTFDPGDDDPRLTRLLQAVRADADPALWTRVRARIESRRHLPALLAWAMRPAALAASVALLVVAAGVTLMLGAPTPTLPSTSLAASLTTTDEEATLGDALVAERDAEAITPAVTAPAAGSASRGAASGAARDSGDRR
jgi:hypothetical protein